MVPITAIENPDRKINIHLIISALTSAKSVFVANKSFLSENFFINRSFYGFHKLFGLFITKLFLSYLI
jgi:hypothetical protein